MKIIFTSFCSRLSYITQNSCILTKQSPTINHSPLQVQSSAVTVRHLSSKWSERASVSEEDWLTFLSSWAASPQNTTWATRAEYVMNAPTVWQKCAELGPVLTNCPVKELHPIWKAVVERIFCLGGWRGWGVSTTLRTQHPREYQAIAAFLSSTGPLLSQTPLRSIYQIRVPRVSPLPLHHLPKYPPELCPSSWLLVLHLACSSSASTASSTS